MNSTNNQDIRSRLVGTWTLKSWTVKHDDGSEVNYFGDSPNGILIYSPEGYMSAHIARSDRENHTSNGLYDNNTEEMVASFKSYFGYYGKFYLENENTIVHHVMDAQFPNWKNDLQKRFFTLEGTDLEIITPPIETEGRSIVHHVIWQRAVL